MFTRAIAAAASLLVASASANSKRGLVFTPNSTFPDDAYIWTAPPTDLTWYYNYKPLPSQIYSNVSQSDFEFVPMLWGAPSDISDKSFYNTIKTLIDERGVNVTHILTFNEPDGPGQYGGSDIDPEVAAQVWVNNIVPLQEDYKALRVGLPACTGAPAGMEWSKKFLEACSGLISEGEKTKNCTFDFVPIHWYGNFEGLASHMGEYSAAFPNKSMWVTEYNLANANLQETQAFYTTSAEYLDRLDFVERYSLFGAFRSDVSNIGPNAAMLNRDGELTDIGAWYLGRQATGVDPNSGKGGKDSGAVRMPTPRLVTLLLVSLLGLVNFA
ncbi:glycosyl hydrolase catalytic core-domain-containing protein [Neurospora hispaniola]|uniref:Glycosyl hydrolase catalytic core-domain-containing protein n=1 Tax=Neurospora hispaniola TaxID=588809 RepID=A0AAJ0HYC4_9PEZI|nr:glycosyl hydrolase catalytic core-domain-containing protein [Neurospora hispaniola]